VGKLILDRFVLNRKPLFEEYMQSGDRSFLSAENKILGFDHAEIGYEVCRHWKIPESLANTIRFHHSAANVSNDGLSAIVFMANTIANMAEAMEMVGAIEQNSLEAVMYLVDDNVMQHLNLDETGIGEIMKTALNGVKQISAGFAPGT
jgi:HD-like signal output (HDOD) protein